MMEVVSPESKLYVKEEVEKAKKEIKEDIEKANSKAARTFTIVGVVLGILTGVGVYGLAVNYMNSAISKGLEEKGIKELKSEAITLVEEIRGYESKAQTSSTTIDEIEKRAQTQDFILLSQKIKNIQIEEVINEKGQLPKEKTFTSHGGVVLLLVSGSGFSKKRESIIGIEVFVDGKSKGVAKSFTNEAHSHKSFVPTFIVLNSLRKGTHTIKISALNGTNIDYNDFFSLTALELPNFE